MNEIQIIESYTRYLLEKGVYFYSNGFPVLKSEWYINSEPLYVVPFSKRKYYKTNKSKVSICFFEEDKYLYPRLDKLFNELDLFKEYHSVCMMDISISPLMANTIQKTNLLINLLYICIIAVNGIKIIPSFRTANYETINLLKNSIGYSKYWIMGAIGTQKENNSVYEELFRSKCLIINPQTLLIYGAINFNTKKYLECLNIKHKIFKDFCYLSYSGEIRYE